MRGLERNREGGGGSSSTAIHPCPDTSGLRWERRVCVCLLCDTVLACSTALPLIASEGQGLFNWVRDNDPGANQKLDYMTQGSNREKTTLLLRCRILFWYRSVTVTTFISLWFLNHPPFTSFSSVTFFCYTKHISLWFVLLLSAPIKTFLHSSQSPAQPVLFPNHLNWDLCITYNKCPHEHCLTVCLAWRRPC